MKNFLRYLALNVPPISGVMRHRRVLLSENASLRSQLDQAVASIHSSEQEAQQLCSSLVSDPDPFSREGGSLSSASPNSDKASWRNDESILDLHTSEPPSHELALGIFAGTWSSNIPGFGLGAVKLFDDDRIKWLDQMCGGIKGKNVLELGPLEGGHTFMLAEAGASRVLSIESNSKAFLKCLTVQNALKFKAEFLYGDFQGYLDGDVPRFDIVLASGVLYHMVDPIGLLQKIARASDSMLLWTHYYDSDVIQARPELKKKFDDDPLRKTVGSREVLLHRQSYLEALQWEGFSGGAAPISYWLTKECLIGVLEDLGMKVTMGADQKDHENGPAILLYASRL